MLPYIPPAGNRRIGEILRIVFKVYKRKPNGSNYKFQRWLLFPLFFDLKDEGYMLHCNLD
jgi:hypothetical protein